MGISNPFKFVEIINQFGLNYLSKYSWFVKTSFTEVDELFVFISDVKNVSVVLNNLQHLKVRLSL